MFAKIKSSFFIDALRLQINTPKGNFLRGVLKDDTGNVCRTIEKDILTLPYGRYTLELSHGDDEMKMNLVKRV